jgi:transposase
MTIEGLQSMDETALRSVTKALLERIKTDSQQIQTQAAELQLRQAQIDKLTHEIALLRHLRFAAKTESSTAQQRLLFAEANAEDLSAAEKKLAELSAATPTTKPKQRPARQTLPKELPRIEVKHEPTTTTCGCGQPMRRIREDVSERLDYVPGTFRVERHVRGVWVCQCCECVRQEAMPAQIINGGIPTANLLAHVVVSKYMDHLPLFRQSKMFARCGVELSMSTLADWVGACGVALSPLVQALKEQLLQSHLLHADESPITILGTKGQTQRGYIWAYASGVHEPLQAAVFEVQAGRSGQYARNFLRHAPPRDCGRDKDPPQGKPWSGCLLVDDYGGYKALFASSTTLGDSDAAAKEDTHAKTQGILEVGCWAHVRRKFFELEVASKSTLAQTAMQHIRALYALEEQMREQQLPLTEVLVRRQQESLPRLNAFYDWLQASRATVLHGTATAKAMDYALKRWPALLRYCYDATLPMDNNRVENLIRPWALGRKNWLFSGSLAAGQRAADIASLLQSAKMNGHEPMAYLSDVLNRLPTPPYSRINELLPTGWKQTAASKP